MRQKVLAVIGILVVLSALVGAVAAGGETRQLVFAGIEMGPFLILAILAQLGERRLWARILTYFWLVMLVLALAIVIVGMTWSALSSPTAPTDGPTAVEGLLQILIAMLGAFVLAATLLFRVVRNQVARVLPIDPHSLMHKVALFYIIYFAISSFAQLAVLHGQPSLLAQVDQLGDTGRSSDGQLLDMFYGLAWTLPMALIAAGYPIRRSIRQAVVRLGFTVPTRWQLLAGVLLAFALVFIFTGVDRVISLVWTAMGWSVTNEAAFKKLMGAGFSPLGALAVGITAGIGEEATTRGLLQPRLGKLLPNLAFAGAHAFQYGFDALLSVFLMGMILAFVRARTSTTIAALVHGGYDFLSIIADYVGI